MSGLYALSAGLVVSLVSFSGAFVLCLGPERLAWLIPNLVALAVGVLLGDAFIHLIPDAIELQGSVSEVCLTALAGVWLFFLLEKVVRWRHDHFSAFRCQDAAIKPLARMNLAGDAVHNFVDGILIAGSFLVDPVLGLTTSLAVVVHEVPQELGDVGALIKGGYAPKRAVILNFYCSLTVLAGVLFTLAMERIAASSLVLLLPIAAGGFIYVAASDLIPALHEHSGFSTLVGQVVAVLAGVGFMQFITVVEAHLAAT